MKISIKATEQDDAVGAALDAAVEVMLALPVGQWGPWAVYLLEMLDAKTADKAAFRGVLDVVLDAVLARSYLGRW